MGTGLHGGSSIHFRIPDQVVAVGVMVGKKAAVQASHHNHSPYHALVLKRRVG